MKVLSVNRKGLHTLRGYISHFNELKNPSQRMRRNQCLLRYGRRLYLTGYEGVGNLGDSEAVKSTAHIDPVMTYTYIPSIRLYGEILSHIA
jgi:hypothetical protein